MPDNYGADALAPCWLQKGGETPAIERSADVRITGEVVDGASGRPLAGMEVRAKITGGIIPRSAFPDEAGHYEIVYEELAALFREEGYPEELIDTIFAELDLDIFLEPVVEDCRCASINPEAPQFHFITIESLPADETRNFSLVESGSVLFKYADTAIAMRPNTFSANLSLRSLSDEHPYARWAPLELDLLGGRSTVQCLPLGQPVEVLSKVTEYRLNPELEILEEWVWKDTLTLTEDSSIEVTIDY